MARNDQRFEQLKQKYQPVQNAMAQHQVRLQNLSLQEDKLYMRGEAASQEARSRVWDAIKIVDPLHSDLIADITVNQAAETPRTQTAGANAAGGQSDRTHHSQCHSQK